MSCSTNQSENILNEIIDSMGAEFPNIIRNPEKHFLQILYTQINRNQKNEPIFKTFSFCSCPGRNFKNSSPSGTGSLVLA